jgi:ferrous iron transport protein B
MMDTLEQRGIRLDTQKLAERLGVPVVPLVATSGKGLIELKQAVSRTPLPVPERGPSYPPALEQAARTLARRLTVRESAAFSEALLLLSSPTGASSSEITASKTLDEAVREAQKALEAASLDPLSAPVEARYAWASDVCTECMRHDGEALHASTSDRIDAVLTHKYWGWAAFLFAMGLMFFSIFSLAQIPMEWIEDGTSLLSSWLEKTLPDGNFRSLVLDGALAGVTAVLKFLPQILILSLFLGVLEDSGYMARAAFLMDRLMSRVGLHGKSFIPMLSSFACAIPGIMATRTIEQRKDRLVTILVAPLMSCSARLPVYTLLISVMLADAPAWERSAIMLSMYVLGIACAFLMAWLFKKTLLRSETPLLIMEMPPYRLPSGMGLFLRLKERAWLFLKRAGTVILALSVLLWALTNYPKPEKPDATGSERIAHSVAGRMGKAIEPLIAPLGFDWKIGVGLIGSLAAREVFVSTMSVVYNVETGENAGEIRPLTGTMRAEVRADGTPVYTPLVSVALMVFYVLAMQCISTLAVVRRETNSWGWPLFQFAYMSILAWIASFLIYQGGMTLGWH